MLQTGFHSWPRFHERHAFPRATCDPSPACALARLPAVTGARATRRLAYRFFPRRGGRARGAGHALGLGRERLVGPRRARLTRRRRRRGGRCWFRCRCCWCGGRCWILLFCALKSVTVHPCFVAVPRTRWLVTILTKWFARSTKLQPWCQAISCTCMLHKFICNMKCIHTFKLNTFESISESLASTIAVSRPICHIAFIASRGARLIPLEPVHFAVTQCSMIYWI